MTKAYFLHIPNWIYAMTAYGSSKRDAVIKFKKQHGIGRMPRGYKIWEAA